MIVFRAIYLVVPLAAFLFLSPFPAQASADVKSTFLYSLANFHGKLPYNEVRVRVDRARDEVYVVERGIVRVFNESGMEFYWFGDNSERDSASLSGRPSSSNAVYRMIQTKRRRDS